MTKLSPKQPISPFCGHRAMHPVVPPPGIWLPAASRGAQGSGHRARPLTPCRLHAWHWTRGRAMPCRLWNGHRDGFSCSPTSPSRLWAGHRSGQDFLLLCGHSDGTLASGDASRCLSAIEHGQEGSSVPEQLQLPSILLRNACLPFSYHHRGGAGGRSGAIVF